ncbi:MAG: glycosyltransferase family 4 protein [Verrucomicrobia bacterium]|nr:glycosyltransferase family 4 protein [Verrucomicrobiota bacterium]
MKILVYAHQLEVGGTQTNAIELAAALRDFHGHEVVMFATPGPMVELIQKKGLRYLPAPDGYLCPSPARMKALRRAVRAERPDLIHAWDWWQCLDAYYGEHLLRRIPLVVTDMMMVLTRILPKRLLTTFGVPELVDQARAAGRRAELLLPPVDTRLNAPGAVEVREFRERYRIKDDELTLVTVCRLENYMKGESLRRTIAAVRELGRELPLRLMIVGDGVARAELEQSAAQVNAELGRSAVVLTGAMLDPRPAYELADVVVGMGGSALRGMAFGKAVLIVGEQGFSLPFSPETADSFYYRGIYGTGDGDPENRRHIENLRRLAGDHEALRRLGDFARRFVLQHFALETVAARLDSYFKAAVDSGVRRHTAAVDGLRTAAIWLRERRMISYRFWQRVKRPHAKSGHGGVSPQVVGLRQQTKAC